MKTEKPEHLLREFNRLHTKQWELLSASYLHSSYSLTEARILFELARDTELTPTSLSESLGLDKGYVSRMISKFVDQGLVQLKPSKTDGRVRFVQLSNKGIKEFNSLQTLADKQAKEFLESLPDERRTNILSAYRILRDEMLPSVSKDSGLQIRHYRAGDLGLILARHGAMYERELGWGIEFEAYVAETLSVFAKKFDPQSERIWIAERDGQFLGCVGLVKASKTIAQLRWLLVEPEARGLGLGKKLIEETISFSKASGYKEMILWTEQTREAARNLYRKFGFQILETKETKTFGSPVVEEKWGIKF